MWPDTACSWNRKDRLIRPETSQVCGGMTAVITGGMIFAVPCMIRGTRRFLVLCPCLKMSVKRPNGTVTQGTGNQTEREQVAEHGFNISVLSLLCEKIGIISVAPPNSNFSLAISTAKRAH